MKAWGSIPNRILVSSETSRALLSVFLMICLNEFELACDFQIPVIKILTLVIFIRYVELLARDGKRWLDSAFSGISISNALVNIFIEAWHFSAR